MELGKRSWRDEQGNERLRVSRLLLHKGYLKLEPSAEGAEEELPTRKRSSIAVSAGPIYQKEHQQQQHHQRRKWRFKVRPKVKVLYSTISRLVRRLRDSYVKVMLTLVAKARDASLLAAGGSYKTKSKTAIGNGWMLRYGTRGGGSGCDLSDVERKYLDYIKRSVSDGELAYYTTSLRSTGIL